MAADSAEGGTAMVVQYVNRKGDTYYLHEATTKTGKPKWFFSTKAEGTLAQAVPPGYEVYENHNAQVFLRREVPQLVTAEEIAVVERAVRKRAKLTYYVVEAKKDSIIVFLPNQNTEFLEGSVTSRFGITDLAKLLMEMHRYLTYSPVMKFTLVDAECRRFVVERWCFLGSIDDWFPLTGSGDLSAMVAKYVPHLGQDSYYELT
jgi:hypothetical protein